MDIYGAKLIGTDEIRLTFGPLIGNFYVYEVQVSDLPFEVFDDEGGIDIISYELSGPSVTLKLNRKPGQGLYVNGAAKQDPLRITPVDFDTHMPMLSFYKVAVEF